MFNFTDNITCNYASDEGFSGLQGRGKLVVTKVTEKLIRGRFEFVTAKNAVTLVSKTVTDGEFCLELIR